MYLSNVMWTETCDIYLFACALNFTVPYIFHLSLLDETIFMLGIFTCVRFQMSSSSSSSGISPPSVRHEVLFGSLGAHASPPSALSSPPPPPSALSYPPGIRPPPFQRTSGPSRGGPPLLYRYPNGPDWQTTKCKVGRF
jgi:hypothetical protein